MVKDDTSFKIKEELETSRKNESLLVKLLENSSQPFGVGYPDGRLGLVNKAFEELTGYSREELKNTDWSEILTPPEFQDMEKEKLEELQQTGQPVMYEKEYIKKDGTRVPIELLVHIVKNDDGSPEYYYSFITDIRERKISEKLNQKLLENEQQLSEELTVSNKELLSQTEELQLVNRELVKTSKLLSTIFEMNPDAIALTRVSDGVIIDCNQEFLNQIGYCSDEVIGHTSLELNLFDSKERQAYWDEIRNKGKLINFELKIKRKDDTFKDVLYSAKHITFNGEKVLLNISKDITERKKIEESLRESEERFRAVQENSLARFTILKPFYDAQGGIIDFTLEYQNTRAAETTGHKPEELIGRRMIEIWPTFPKTRFFEMYKLAMETEKAIEFEQRYNDDGLDEWFYVKITPIPEGIAIATEIITERKKALEQLKESEEKYSNLFERMNEGFTIAEMIYNDEGKPYDFRWIDMNHAYEEILGFTRDTLLSTTARAMFPELQPKLVENFGKVMLTGKQLQFENYNIELNKWFDVIAYKITQEHFAFLTLDITKRKKIEKLNQKLLENEQQLTEELRTSNEELQSTTKKLLSQRTELQFVNNELLKSSKLLSTIYDLNPDAIVLTTVSDSKIIDCNQEYLNQIGYTREETIGHTSKELNLISEITRNTYIDETRGNEKVSNFEGKIKRKDGSFIDVVYSSRQITVNNVSMVLNIGHDITESKKIQDKLVLQSKALKKSETSLANAQHIAHIGSWEWNIKTGDIIWSNELYSIYGVDPNTFTPTLSSFGDYMHPDDEEYVNQHVDQLLSENKSHNFDFRIILDDGSIRVLNTLAEVGKFDKDGDPEIIIGINQDITDRKEIELKLNENIKKLAQSNKELEQFAYITSHDLREPLRMITSFLQLLERRYKDELDQDANEFIGFAVDGAKRLDTMTKDLLKYSQITHKKRDIIPINFEHVLEHASTNLKVQIEENNAIITHDPLPTINGNEELKIQLFQNIIGNAIKYRSQETPKIHISAIKEKDHYLFSIKDNGIGMSSKHIEKIFTIFQRLHTHDEYEGTGIGLAIAQKIVHQQGGQIWVESELGKGSTFYFTIPTN